MMMTSTGSRYLLALSAGLYVAAIVAANWLTTTYGFVPVGFGLSATAGTFAAGATFTLRDDVQDRAGLRWVFAVILAGCAVSFLVADPAIAGASLAAFALAEGADFGVYTPLRRRNWTAAVMVSGFIGAVVDTVVFLRIAFGSAAVTADAVAGQIVGKMGAVGAVWVLLVVLRRFTGSPAVAEA